MKKKIFSQSLCFIKKNNNGIVVSMQKGKYLKLRTDVIKPKNNPIVENCVKQKVYFLLNFFKK